jgi:hypothetical protein
MRHFLTSLPPGGTGLVRQSETMQRLEEERLTQTLEAEREQDEEQQRQMHEAGEMRYVPVRVSCVLDLFY